jgi:hypothetical protein
LTNRTIPPWVVAMREIAGTLYGNGGGPIITAAFPGEILN